MVPTWLKNDGTVCVKYVALILNEKVVFRNELVFNYIDYNDWVINVLTVELQFEIKDKTFKPFKVTPLNNDS